VSVTESKPRENVNDASYDTPEKLFIYNPDRKIQIFEDCNMFWISFFSNSGCSISVKLAFAEDPATQRKEMLFKRN
jgi:hypothetical protein